MLAPGYGGSSTQPIILAMAERLEAAGIQSRPISFSRARPSGDFSSELDDLRRARDSLLGGEARHVALIGRSFGGRMCTRLAVAETPAALIVLGHPISPPRRRRPDDEVALTMVRCPTLIVQGEHDHLGPVAVLERIAAANPHIELHVLGGVGHQFGSRQNAALDDAVRWLSAAAAAPGFPG